jgi:hypothetical protein
MTAEATTKAIPQEIALALCREIRKERQGKWWLWTAWWCWGCEKASGADPAKMCWHNHPQHRGCAQVNALYSARFVRRDGH